MTDKTPIIDPEFEKLIPSLNKDELKTLTESLLEGFDSEKYGKIILWEGHNVIVDGHHRFHICTENHISYETTEKFFADRDEVKEWIIINQFNRRNLSPKVRKDLIGRLYLIRKGRQGGDHKSNNFKENDIESSDRSLHLISDPKTRNVIAEETGVSEGTVQDAADFATAIDLIVEHTGMSRAELLSKEIKITQQDIKKIGDMEAEDQKLVIEKIKAEKPKQAKETSLIINTIEAEKIGKDQSPEIKQLVLKMAQKKHSLEDTQLIIDMIKDQSPKIAQATTALVESGKKSQEIQDVLNIVEEQPAAIAQFAIEQLQDGQSTKDIEKAVNMIVEQPALETLLSTTGTSIDIQDIMDLSKLAEEDQQEVIIEVDETGISFQEAMKLAVEEKKRIAEEEKQRIKEEQEQAEEERKQLESEKQELEKKLEREKHKKEIQKKEREEKRKKLQEERIKQQERIRKEEVSKQIWFDWLACNSTASIAENTEMNEDSVISVINKMKTEIEDIPPDSLQLWNIWSFDKNNENYGIEYPGRIPGQIIENLLYYYTQMFDVVIDPFAGGGTTMDVCNAMNRRFLIYDLVPSRPYIRNWDISNGFPVECQGCTLIFLDPPYWDQKKGEYSADPTNLANLNEEHFYAQMKAILESAWSVLKNGGYVAYIISPTTKNKLKHYHGYEIAKMAEAIGFQIWEWIDVPFGTERATGFHINKAKKDKVMLTLKRDLVVLKKNE